MQVSLLIERVSLKSALFVGNAITWKKTAGSDLMQSVNYVMVLVMQTKLAPSDKTQSTENAEVEEETLFMASTDSFYDIDNLEWLIDSGCSNHMTPSEDVFVSLDKGYKQTVKVGNVMYLDVFGKGTGRVISLSGFQIYFRSRFPLFNSEPTECWTNVGALLYSALQGFGICTIYEPNGNYLMTVPMKNRSFSLNWKETCMQATQSPGTDTELWHKRLEHCNYISLKQVSSTHLLKNLPILSDKGQVCSVFPAWKDVQEAFSICIYAQSQKQARIDSYRPCRPHEC